MDPKDSLKLTKEIQNRVADLCRQIAKEKGITLKRTNATYGTDEIRLSIAYVIDRAAAAQSTEVYGIETGLKIGDRFQYGGIVYVVESFNRAGNIIALRSDGKRLIFRDRSENRAFRFLTRMIQNSDGKYVVGMTKEQAHILCRDLNPPIYENKPMPYAVVEENGAFVVQHLPSKKIIRNYGGDL